MSNKFENIKEGDSVLAEIHLKSTVFHRGEYFWVGRKVQRVTPKQFVVDGKKYRKDTGSQIGGYGDVKVYDKEKDQTKEADGYRMKCSADAAVKELSCKRLCDHITVEQAEKLVGLSEEILKEADL